MKKVTVHVPIDVRVASQRLFAERGAYLVAAGPRPDAEYGVRSTHTVFGRPRCFNLEGGWELPKNRYAAYQLPGLPGTNSPGPTAHPCGKNARISQSARRPEFFAVCRCMAAIHLPSVDSLTVFLPIWRYLQLRRALRNPGTLQSINFGGCNIRHENTGVPRILRGVCRYSRGRYARVRQRAAGSR